MQYTPRPSGMLLSDMIRDDVIIKLSDQYKYNDRILDAIHTGRFIAVRMHN